MFERDDAQIPGSGAALITLLVGAVVGAAALLLGTKQGKQVLEQATLRADQWKAQAAATLAETREKVVSSVEAETSSPGDFPEGPGPQVRGNL